MELQPGWTFAAAAIQLGITRGRVSQLVKEGRLRTITLLGRNYITQDAIRKYQLEMAEQKRAKEGSHVDV